jgi:hypothetical protein
LERRRGPPAAAAEGATSTSASERAAAAETASAAAPAATEAAASAAAAAASSEASALLGLGDRNGEQGCCNDEKKAIDPDHPAALSNPMDCARLHRCILNHATGGPMRRYPEIAEKNGAICPLPESGVSSPEDIPKTANGRSAGAVLLRQRSLTGWPCSLP